MSAITLPTDTLRSELELFTPNTDGHYGVFYRFTPIPGSLRESRWGLLMTTCQHDLAVTIADLYGDVVIPDGRTIETMIKLL